MSASHLTSTGEYQVSPVKLWETAHTKQDKDNVIQGSTTWECGRCLSVSLWENRAGGGNLGGGGGAVFGSPWAKPQLRDIINSKLAAEQHDLCSLRNYHSTLFTKTGRIESFLIFYVSFLNTLTMYCMKALGVVHFKGNWTNIEKNSAHCLYRAFPFLEHFPQSH